MAGSSIDASLPALTRLVRASALLAAQGASVGFALNTLWLWSRITEFVGTNKIPNSDRKVILVCLITPAIVWVALWLLTALLKPRPHHHLSFLERFAQRWSWLIAIGFVPVLLHPTLWKTRTLMFLISTGVATLVVWWSIRVSQKGFRGLHGCSSSTSQLETLMGSVKSMFPASLRVLAPLFILFAVIIFIVARGVWLDPTLTASRVTPAPSASTSVRQAFILLGHGGWLGLPFAIIKAFRPPSNVHLVLWATGVSIAAFPLYLWAKHHVGSALALFVSLAYLSMPMLRTLGHAELVPLGLAAGLFFWATAEWDRNRIRRALLLSLLTVGVHEQAALWFVCFGIYLTFSTSNLQRGRLLALGALVYFGLVAFAFLPSFGRDAYGYDFRGMWGARPVGLIETAIIAFSNPAYVLVKWLELQGLQFWLALLVPFAFLPVCGKRWVLWVVPGVVFGLVGPGHSPKFPFTAGALAHFVVLGFVASVTTLGRLRATAQTRGHAHAAVIAWAFALVPSVYQLGGLWLPAP
ncbi:MAG: DUF2079 domain-containing protein [Myxococcales bacterium]